MKYNIIYIGESCKFLNILQQDSRFCVKFVFCEESRVSQELKDAAKKLLITVKDKSELETKIQKIKPQVDFFIMYSTSLIIPQSLIEEFDFYNIHTGSLYTNRGRNPIVWSIILGDDSTILTLHKISPEIDTGTIVSEQHVKITDSDTFSEVKANLETKLPNILDDLILYLNNKKSGKQVIQKGIYRRKIMPEDYTINLENDSLKILKRKINSQNTYSGAILNVDDQTFNIVGINSINYNAKVLLGGRGTQVTKRFATFLDNCLMLYFDEYIIDLKYRR